VVKWLQPLVFTHFCIFVPESTALRCQPSTTDLPIHLTALDTELQTLEAKLASFRSSNSAEFFIPTPEDIANVDAEWLKWREQWKMRKRIFKE